MIRGPYAEDHEYHNDDRSPPYIDHMFVDTGSSRIIGTAGHSLNHAEPNGRQNRMSKTALVFGVDIDTSTGELSTGSFWIKDFDKLESSEGYITGLRADISLVSKVHLLYQYVTSDKDDNEGLYYVKLSLEDTSD